MLSCYSSSTSTETNQTEDFRALIQAEIKKLKTKTSQYESNSTGFLSCYRKDDENLNAKNRNSLKNVSSTKFEKLLESSEDFNCFCRVCFKQLTLKTNVRFVDDKDVADLLGSYLDLEYKSDVELYPKKVCSDCVNTLRQFSNMVKVCLERDKIFNDFIVNKHAAGAEKSFDFKNKNDNADEEIEWLNEHDKMEWEKYSKKMELEDQKIDENVIKNIRSFKCQHCEETYENEKDLQKHHIEIGLLRTCDYCNDTFHKQSDVTEHKYDKHWENMASVEVCCETCGRTYQSRDSLNTHKKTCRSKQSPKLCSICGVYVFQPATHMQRVHGPEKVVQCSRCFMRMLSSKLSEHKRIAHSADVPLQCHICPKVLAHSYTLKKHLKNHAANKMHTCEVCHRLFMRKTSLKAHYNKVHESTSSVTNKAKNPVE